MFVKTKEMLKTMLSDKRGYGTIELMVIIAALGAVATVIFTQLQGDATSGLTKSADDVSSKIDNNISNW